MAGILEMKKMNERSEMFLRERYYMRGENWERLCKRVAWAHATSDQEAKDFFEMIYSLSGVPSSPILMNSGAERGYLSACNLVPVPDDMSGIFDSMKTAGMIQKFGGGVGFNFSKLRPEGDPVVSTGGQSSGVLAFLKMFNAISMAIRQGGKRRGANMGVLALWHPDILNWIKVKHDPELLKAFNISVGVPDVLYDVADKDEDWYFVNPRNNERSSWVIKARELERLIAREIWHGGEPGILFWDTIQRENSTPWLGNLHGLNPCAEVPLYNYESCVLGSVNLYNHLTPDMKIDHEKLDKTVMTMVIFLNRVLDNNMYPIPEMHEAALKTRKIGVGIMGFADMLYRMEIEYGSAECMDVIDDVMGHMGAVATEQSIRLAEEDGVYLGWEEGAPPLRNANLLSIAPTGSIGYIADVSSGIEPAFDLVYQMNRDGQDPVFFMNRALRDTVDAVVGTTQGLAERIMESGKEWLQELRPYFLTAMDISPVQHINVQARFQQYVDQAISKTINLPEETTVDEISKLIRYAHSKGLKGLTMFRKGCHREAFLEEPKCTQCGDKLIQQDGCSRCRSCGWEACAIV